jgi:hypothetical protein
MSEGAKQTAISNINNQISNEEDEIVNKIINELNDTNEEQPMHQIQNKQMQQQMPPQMPPQMQQQMQQQMPPQMQQQIQQQMQQQQMQQQMQQQQMQQQMQHVDSQQLQFNPSYKLNQVQSENKKEKSKNIYSEFNKYMKDIAIIVMLSFIITLPFTDNMLKSFNISFILTDDNLNLYGNLLKCIVVGIVYFIYKYVS